ncbi:MAG: hypothetical protein AAF737_08180 [Pseudomonadota bacterium]
MQDFASRLGDLETLVKFGLGSLAIWLLTQIASFLGKLLAQRNARIALVRALFAEVQFNAADLSGFLEESQFDALLLKLAEPNYVPHITDARHTQIYGVNIGHIHHIPDHIVKDVVRFYGGLEKIRTQIEGVRLPSYAPLSEAGKATLLARLRTECRDTERLGLVIMKNMQLRYPRLHLGHAPGAP